MSTVAAVPARTLPWWDDPTRACLGKDTEIFYPAGYGSKTLEALQVCNGTHDRPRCPVLAACATWALHHPGHGQASEGIWGGMTATGRVEFLNRLRARRAGPAARAAAIDAYVSRHIEALEAHHA